MCFMWAHTARLAARFHAPSHHGHTVTAAAKASRIQGMDGVAFQRGGQHHPTVHAQNTPPAKRTCVAPCAPADPSVPHNAKSSPAPATHCVRRRADRCRAVARAKDCCLSNHPVHPNGSQRSRTVHSRHGIRMAGEAAGRGESNSQGNVHETPHDADSPRTRDRVSAGRKDRRIRQPTGTTTLQTNRAGQRTPAMPRWMPIQNRARDRRASSSPSRNPSLRPANTKKPAHHNRAGVRFRAVFGVPFLLVV